MLPAQMIDQDGEGEIEPMTAIEVTGIEGDPGRLGRFVAARLTG